MHDLISVDELVCLFVKICGGDHVFTAPEDLYMYGSDQTADFHFNFDILIKPVSAEEIADILKICNRYAIPVTPRGGGSGVTGGALPVMGGVVLSMERLNRIIAVNRQDAYVIAEAGVVTADLCKRLAEEGLYFPVIPTSAAYSFVGGNVAENAGSVNSCKYGTTGQYILNLEVVLPTGEIIWSGANVTKNATGLNLTQLFAGSEGILGIITKVVYRLLPVPRDELTMLIPFRSLKELCEALVAIRLSELLPSAAELIGRNAFDLVTAHTGITWVRDDKDMEAFLFIELQEISEPRLIESMDAIVALLEKYAIGDVLVAQTGPERNRLRQIRSGIGDALSVSDRRSRDIDVSVSLSFLYEYIRKVEDVCTRHFVPVIWFGHALDGNLHVMLLLDKGVRLNEDKRIKAVVHEIYDHALPNGGVISGEHGIGILQSEFMQMQFSAAHLDLMKRIKLVFDPNRILNPGKIFN